MTSSMQFSGLDLKAYATNIAAHTYLQKEKNVPHYFVVELNSQTPSDDIRLDGVSLGKSEAVAKIAQEVRKSRYPSEADFKRWSKQLQEALQEFKPTLNRYVGRKFKRPLVQFYERNRSAFLKALDRSPSPEWWGLRYEHGGDGPLLPVEEALTPFQRKMLMADYRGIIPKR